MSDFVIENGVLEEYKGKDEKVVIPEHVTSIGDSAFYGCNNLISVEIPPSVTKIGSASFSECKFLTSVTLFDNVKSIGRSAFYDCVSLTSITIPNSVTIIGNSAFANCQKLVSISLSENLKSIGDSAFKGCGELKEFVIGKKVYYCNLSKEDGITPLLRFILLKIKDKKFSELPDDDLAHFFMWGYYKRTGDKSALSYVGDYLDEKLVGLDSEEKFQALMESAMEEDNPSALPSLEKFSMYLTPPQVTHYLYLGVDKKARKVSMLLWDYMETDSFILEDYKLTKHPKYVAYIKEHFETFMNNAIEQNDIKAVQVFTEAGEFFTPENIEVFMHTCLSKKKRDMLMILLDYQANQFAE